MNVNESMDEINQVEFFCAEVPRAVVLFDVVRAGGGTGRGRGRERARSYGNWWRLIDAGDVRQDPLSEEHPTLGKIV